jgi:signal transduction histidine kinase
VKCERWPFRPIHITNDGEQAPETSPLRKLTGHGIIANNYLQGIQSAICHSLALPTTIIEYSPDGEPVRTDSPLLSFQMQPGCRALRAHTLGADGEEACLCKKCDACHAGVFAGLRASELQTRIPEALPQSARFRELYSGLPECECHRRMEKGRTFLVYDCPLLGYCETMFPIVFEDVVVGAFFLGQIVLEDKKSFIHQRMKTLLERYPVCFDEYIARSKTPLRSQDILDDILSRHEEWLSLPGTTRTQAEFDALVTKACGELLKLEEQLQIEMREQRQRYIGEKVTAHIGRFQEDLPPDVPDDADQALGLLWTNLKGNLAGVADETKPERSITGIVDEFAFRYMVVFGVSSETVSAPTSLEIVAVAGLPPGQFSDVARRKGILSDIGDLPRDSSTGTLQVPRKWNSELLGRLRGCDLDACGDAMLVYHPVPLHPLSSIAILVGYLEDNPGKHPDNASDGGLDRALQSFYSVVVSALSAILATSARRHANNQLRILGHEAGQLIAGLDWKRIANLENPSKLRALDDQAAEYLCRDLEGFQKQLHFVFARAQMLIRKPPDPNKELFLAFGELLYKWKDIYRLEAEAKSLQFVMGLERASDPDRPPIYGDRTLLEQLLYNLVNNAVKYCHRGTKIYLDCKLESRQPGSLHLLTVTNFGRKMPDTDRVYDLYWRGDDSEPGFGIGLHLARQIARAHGGSISHESVKVSDYNVPLIEPFLKPSFRFAGQPSGLRERLCQEWDSLQGNKLDNEVVAKNDKGGPKYSPTLGALGGEIRQPTYRVTVSVRIPREGGLEK